MRLTKITIEGFLSYKTKQVIDFSKFDDNSVIGIMGENLDSLGGYTSNGAGKSNFINAISWCLTDMIAVQAEGKLVKDEVINDSCKKATIEIEAIINTGELVKIVNSKTRSSKSFKLARLESYFTPNKSASVNFHSLDSVSA